jgi:hypothetical protein
VLCCLIVEARTTNGEAVEGEMSEQQPTAKPENESQIPYHQVYFSCCNRIVMTRADIAQPGYCPFCGKGHTAPAQPAFEQVALQREGGRNE